MSSSGLTTIADMVARPIFILAPLPRCGTNFLWDLLRLHQDCAAGRSPIWEDYLLKNSGPLVDFVDAAQRSWDRVWGPTEHLRAELKRSLGDALVQFLTVEPDRRLLTKSPALDNLEYFFDFFPAAHLILLVRDGRDVVDSGITTFGWDLEDAARAWAAGVDRVTKFTTRTDVPDAQCSVVRYEDLVQRPVDTIAWLLQALDLAPDRFDFAAIDSMPVRGSSTHRGEGRVHVHWDPIPRDATFSPIRRWHSWDDRSSQLFSAVAGPQLRHLGYEA